MDKLEEKFDNLNPTAKVDLLKVSQSTPYYYEILTLFHNRKLCIRCGELPSIGDRYMIPIDGEWPTRYFNLWVHKECVGKDMSSLL